MSRDCAEWQGILAMDAVGLASQEETSALDEHLAKCPTCRQDAADLQWAAKALQSVDPAQLDHLDEQPVGTGELVGFPSDASEEDPAKAPVPVPSHQSERHAPGRAPRVLIGIGSAILATAAAVMAVLAIGGTPAPATKTVALRGVGGVQASVSLTAQSWGTSATLQESGQAPGQVLTVSMRTAYGRWWIAGSYRTGTGPGPLVVQLSCAVQSNKITDVWISDPSGRTVLNGYVH
jgi:anti-sigma factor RsiW